MGCGKSKHDVASGNTLLQHKKTNVNSMEDEAQIAEKKNNGNIDNVSLKVDENNQEDVKETGVEGKDNESNVIVETTKVQVDKALKNSAQAEVEENKAQKIVVAEEPNEVSKHGKDESLEKNEEVVDLVVDKKQPIEEKTEDGNEKENASSGKKTLTKEEENKFTNEETLVKEEEGKTTNEETTVKEEESKKTNEEALVKEEESKNANENTLAEETEEATNQEKTLVKEGETEDANV